MKTKLITFAIILSSTIASFAQGKISFANDSLHLYYWSPVIGNFLTGDEGLAGTAALNVPTPSGRSLGVSLYGGTSAGSLSLLASTTLSATLPGQQDVMNLTLPGFPGGTPAFFQIRIQDTFLGYYHGESEVFQCTPSSNIAFNNLFNHGGTALSTWADGTFNLDSLALGSRGAIEIVGTPEPASGLITLVGAGMLGLIRRRRWSHSTKIKTSNP